MQNRVWSLWVGFAVIAWTAGAAAQQDVICSNMGSIAKNGTVGDMTAYSLSSTSCNIGNQVADWFDNSNQHPLIGGNIYRIKDGHLEQVGMGWLKHSFCAVNENSCGNCQNTPCSTLGVGCADTYSTGLNGSQSNLGPRSDVNASTGFYNWPFPTQGQTGNAIYKRIQVHNDDIDPALNPGALFFGVVHYMTTDEPNLAVPSQFNNNSYRMLEVGSFSQGGWNLGYTGGTIVKDPIQAWQDNLPGEVDRVVINPPENNGESMMVIGTRVEDLGGGQWRYQYAVLNDGSRRGARTFTVPISPSVTLSNITFTDVDYHSGEPYDLTDWDVTQQATSITWSTDLIATNSNANAIRWGTTYSFGFDADAPPQDVSGTIGLFRNGPGSGFESFTIAGPGDPPPIEFTYPAGLPTLIDNIGGTFEVNIDAVGGAVLDPTSPTLHYDDGGGFQTVPLVSLGGSLYEAQFPALACAINVDFYLSASTTAPATVTDPPAAPAVVYTTTTGDSVTQDLDELETDTGWTAGAAGDTATTGVWERVNPIGTAAQPEDDHSPTGTICWVTGQGSPGGSLGENDVDSGDTTLLTPVYDMSLMNNPTISYWRWFSNDQGASPNNDVFTIDIRSSGSNWVNVEVVGPNDGQNNGGWLFNEILVTDFVPLTATVQMRFIAEDAGNGSIVEAAVDDFLISDITCDGGEPVFTRGDCNGDGGIDISDPITLLQGVFGGGTIQCFDSCDVNDDGGVQLDDALYMLNHQFQQGPAPLAPFPNCGTDPSADGLAECMGATGCP